MQSFYKITTNAQHELYEYLMGHHLMASIIFMIIRRVRTTDSKILGLNKGEFVLSSSETKKFRLPTSQHGKIERCIQVLLRTEYIQNTGRRTGKNATIYKWAGKEFLDFDMLRTGNETGNKQETDRKQTGNRQEGTLDTKILDTKILREREGNVTLTSFIKNKDEILEEAKSKFKDKDCNQAIEDFIEYCQIKSPDYRNYKAAYLKWVREDRYEQYYLEPTRRRVYSMND